MQTRNCLKKRRDLADTILVPARLDGFNDVFLKKSEWYFVHLTPQRVTQLKYLLIYVAYPTSCITHQADIEAYEKFDPSTKGGLPRYKFRLKNIRPVKNLRYAKCKGLQGPALIKSIDIDEANYIEDLFKD